jgi:hypothetical protein
VVGEPKCSDTGGDLGAFLHCVRDRDQRVVCSSEDAATLVDVISVEADNELL